MMKNKKAREDQAALSGRWSSHRKQPIKRPLVIHYYIYESPKQPKI